VRSIQHLKGLARPKLSAARRDLKASGSTTKCAGSCGRREIVNNYLFDTIPPTCESGCADHPQARKHHIMAETYIPTEQYRAAVNAIAAMTHLDPDEIKIALGEEGNIWPESIHADMIRTAIDDA
jgi:hypothetical protein